MKTKRKNLSFIFVLSLILTLCISVAPVQAATAKSGKVAVTVPKTTLYVGDSKNNSTPITVKYKNKKVTSGIKYSTSNKKIATVKKGKIVASRKGTATISVKYKNKTCRFKITVKNATLNLSNKSLSLQKGKAYTFKTYANKTQIKATSVKWTTSNSKIVSVNKNGTIKALKNGKAVITAKTSFGTAKCTVTVAVSGHTHNWVTIEDTETIPAVTKHQIQCLTCGQWFDSLDDLYGHQIYDTNGACSGFDTHCERDVEVEPAKTIVTGTHEECSICHARR